MSENSKLRTEKKTSIKTEFSIWVISLLIATTGTLTWVVLNQERVALTQEVTRRGVALTQYVATHSIDPFLTEDKLSLATLVADVMKNQDMVYAVIIDGNGRVVASDQSEQTGKAYPRPAGDYPLDRPEPRIYVWLHPQLGWVIDIGMPLILEARAKIGEVHLGITRATINLVVSNAAGKAILLAAVFLLAGLIGSVVIISLMLRPVNELAKGAEAIGRGNLEYEIPRMRQNELGQLATTFNQMTKELKVATEQALEQARIKKELQVAQNIQQRLLPKKLPEVKGFSFAAAYHSAKEVGGDYYDFLPLGQDQWGIAIADVCGKGVPAALLMSMARSVWRSIAPNFSSPAEVVLELNRQLLPDLNRIFITFFYAVVDVKKKRMVYTSAGHNPPILWQAKNQSCQLLELESACLPLGVDSSNLFKKLLGERKTDLQKGDVVVFYTDGITEAMNQENQAFGLERVYAAIQHYATHEQAEEIVRGLEREVNQFCGDVPQSDDIAIVIMKVG